MTEEIKKMKCNRCRVLLPDYKFTKKKNDEYQKSCERCRGIQKEERDNNKCPHNKQRSRCKKCGGSQICSHDRRRSICKDCGGSSICEHNKIRSRCKLCGGSEICIHNRHRGICKDCGGSQICEHNRQRSKCIECGGSQICIHNRQRCKCKECKDAIKITIKNMIFGSRQSDKKKNRYDANNFIDKCFLEGLVEEYPNCYYEDCKVKLQYIEYQDNLATIERLNNSIGHIKSNCVLCCKKCNNMKKSNN
jgi:hypothetical protein